MTAPSEVLDLVERFAQHRDAYRSGRYNETQVRREFLDPLFKALGWDVDNEQGYAEAYKDVVHEDAVKVGGFTKAPDYAFRIGGVRKFFVEAKKPSVDIKGDIHPAFQLRRYAWSAKLPLSILTDFEELAVYDCRVKPDRRDKASNARVNYLEFNEYPDRWDEIAGVFSREAVLKGSFDKYVESNRKKRGTAEVDDVFLEEIEGWRDTLARNFALRNPDLTQRELNFAVQRTIDRIIFLRICEDRGIEDYGRLQGLLNGRNLYSRLCELFEHADARYNSGLFHFRKERGSDTPPDELTLGLALDDKVLKPILGHLYYPDSPYEFSVLPADILGQIYEQFLGKVIRLTKGHRAVVEDKPEVKKAGGVYYTPTYIVDYIIEETVGKLLEGKTPKQAEKLKILDPACGSGSFLLGAYQRLLNWHRDYYVEKGPGRSKKQLYEGPGGEWRLTTAEKKRILLNNVYGVDIDAQAVEVTKLSLLLKVLEGESDETIQTTLRLFHERALPDLGNNIKCGNSLIGPDFYDDMQMELLDEEERYRINVFDWEAEFPSVFQRRSAGFDVVVGNPPYVRIQHLRQWAPEQADYFSAHYESAKKGNYDIYVVFVERALGLLSERGGLGFIMPHKFMNAAYGEPLRTLLAAGAHVQKIVHFGDQQVFADASTYTCLLFLSKDGKKALNLEVVRDLNEWQNTRKAEEHAVPTGFLGSTSWNLASHHLSGLLKKLSDSSATLGDIADRIAQGIRTSSNGVYVLHDVAMAGELLQAYSKALDGQVQLESTLVRPFLLGREINRYLLSPSGKAVIMPYGTARHGAELVSESKLRTTFPQTYHYLSRNRSALEARENGRMRGKRWYGYVYPKNIEVMRLPKILVPDIASGASFALDDEGKYTFTSGYAIVLRNNIGASPEFVLGLLNSRLLDMYLKSVSTVLRGGYFRYFTQFLQQVPIRRINQSDRADVSIHDRLVELVQKILASNIELQSASTAHDRTVVQRQVDATDRQIDQLVYELYGLTDKDIRIVEEATKR